MPDKVMPAAICGPVNLMIGFSIVVERLFMTLRNFKLG
jgi:hypothetical protein